MSTGGTKDSPPEVGRQFWQPQPGGRLKYTVVGVRGKKSITVDVKLIYENKGMFKTKSKGRQRIPWVIWEGMKLYAKSKKWTRPPREELPW